MGLLTRELTNFLVKRYYEEDSVKRRVDIIIRDLVPDDVKEKGLEDSVSWALRNLNPTELDYYLRFKEDIFIDD